MSGCDCGGCLDRCLREARKAALEEAVSELQRGADSIDDDVKKQGRDDPELAHHLRGRQLVLRRAAQRIRSLMSAADGPKAPEGLQKALEVPPAPSDSKG